MNVTDTAAVVYNPADYAMFRDVGGIVRELGTGNAGRLAVRRV
jgi:hypothetical protein